ncbi:MAG: hypothetical protein ACTSQJ_10700 [Promethearchaeota archaeon]
MLISDQKEMGIGNVVLSSPPSTFGLKSISTSFQFFGVKEKLLSKIIVEQASNILKSPVLLLFFIKNDIKEEKIAKPLINFLNKKLNEVIEKKT